MIRKSRFRKQLFQLFFWLGLGAVLSVVALEQFYYHTEGYIYWFLGIPVFFGVIGYALVRILRFYFVHNEKHLVNVYLVVRVIKIICTLALIVTYLFVLEEHTKYFLPTIALFYVIYLVWETRFFFSYERRLKRGKKI